MTEKSVTHGARDVTPRQIKWRQAEPQAALGYAFDAILAEDEGSSGYVVSVAQLAGVVSEGENAEAAIKNLVEAFRATIETYIAEEMPIPWRDPPAKQANETRVRVAVNV
jgi:predicted RNase H-like HicB family nuclease